MKTFRVEIGFKNKESRVVTLNRLDIDDLAEKLSNNDTSSLIITTACGGRLILPSNKVSYFLIDELSEAE